MAYGLIQTQNYANTFIEFSPLGAGFGQEPMVTIASEIREMMLSSPFTWSFNRNEFSFVTVAGQQDYNETISDFGFLEKVTLQDINGIRYDIKDVYNNYAIGVASTQKRPDGICVLTRVPGGVCKFRFIQVPDAVYTVTLTYQKLSAIMGPFIISSVANASGGNTVYSGVFDTYALAVGSSVTITNFSNSANNGTFTVGAVTATSLTVNNPSGVAVTATGYVSNLSWAPLPDNYNSVYNALFLGEAFALVGDPRAQIYRQRGVAGLLAKSEGLSDTQKNAFMQQWMQRGYEQQAGSLRIQQAVQGRSV